MQNTNTHFWKKYDRLQLSLSVPRHITQPPSIWHPRRLKPQLRLRTRSEMSQHLYLAISALRDAFALGVLTGFYGKKLHGAIVEVAFFKPNLYAHLPAVSFVD